MSVPGMNNAIIIFTPMTDGVYNLIMQNGQALSLKKVTDKPAENLLRGHIQSIILERRKYASLACCVERACLNEIADELEKLLKDH